MTLITLLSFALVAIITITNLSCCFADDLKLFLMNDAAQQHGAVCLDGTPAGYYFSPARNQENANNFVVHFIGGGWCYSEGDCWGRSKTNLGSSKYWSSTTTGGGIMSDDCSVNPDFCNYNRIMMIYCDGNSFSGNRDEPITYKNDLIYFRGHRILDAVIQSLKDNHGFNQATNVLLTGCSAGGLSTYLHVDYISTLLPATVTRYGAAPDSGFFLLVNNVDNQPVYPEQMKYIFNLANATNGVNQACIEAHAPADQWRCNFAQEAYAHIQSRIFPLNSAYDSWQTACILTATYVQPPNDTLNGNCSAVPGWQNCGKDPNQCSNEQMGPYNQFAESFVDIMNSTTTAQKNGNGGFIFPCHTHCAADDNNAFAHNAINGVTMQQAVSAWWNSDGNDPAQEHFYWPCYYSTNSEPRECNPSCGNSW